MNWKQEAIEKLKDYSSRAASMDNLKEQIANTRADITSMRHSRADAVAVRGSSTSRRDDRLINAICSVEEMKNNLQLTGRWLKTMDNALSKLTQEEYHVLDVFFIHPQKGAVNRLRDEFCLQEESSIYRRREQALRRFTLHMYGMMES